MPNTPLEIPSADFLTELQVPVCMHRIRALAECLARGGSPISYSCLVDSGASLCVVPYSLWHGRTLQWAALGTTLLKGGAVVPDALKWNDVDCILGSTRICLVDLLTRAWVGPLLLLGKFAQSPRTKTEFEVTALLGLNFLIDNLTNLALQGDSGQLTGHFFW
jgi:hypothetical protein